MDDSNIDPSVVDDFGSEWTRFDQGDVPEKELRPIFDAYFRLFPWDDLPPDAAGIDVGAGTGRWARFVVPRVGRLHVVEPSDAIEVARRTLAAHENVVLHHATANDVEVADESLDFGYSLGVLHHVPDTEDALRNCVRKLKPDAPFLVYLYYAFDNRPGWFRALWKVSDGIRRIVSSLPRRPKHVVADSLAATVYFPLARSAAIAERLGMSVDGVPLSSYRDKSFYTMRTDALDRFGTRLEKRYTREEIVELLESAGLVDVRVGDDWPYWCAIGFKR